MALNLTAEIIKPEKNAEDDGRLYHEPANESPQEYELLSAFSSELVELPEKRKKKLNNKKQTKNFKCEICKRKFRLKLYLNLHVLTHTGAKPFKCSVCDKKFTQKSSLNTHVKQFHTSDGKMFECGDCSKKFKLKYFLDMHNLTHNGLKPNKCGLCDSKFTQKSSLNTHVKQFHGSSVEMFECMRCDKKFLRESMLDKHIENHP